MAFRPLTAAERANFETLLSAAKHGVLALVQTYEKDGGKEVALVCALSRDRDQYGIVPLAALVQGDPYELYASPAEDLPNTGEEVTS